MTTAGGHPRNGSTIRQTFLDHGRGAHSDRSLDSGSDICDSLPTDLQERLADILDDYLVSLEQGVPIDIAQIKAANPELADALDEYLTGLAILQQDGAELQSKRAASTDGVPMAKRLGDFELIREVGRGGMGVVYEARQLSLDRFVALKVLPFAAMLDEKQISRFENEARAAAQLHHPNIVPIHGVGSDRGVHFYAMQLINGRSLQQVIHDMRSNDPNSPTNTESLYGSHDKSGWSRTAIDMANGVRCDETREYSPTSQETHIEVRPHVNSAGSELSSNRVRSTRYIESVVSLIVQAAEGLHAAHQYGVIHRDVKPSNLMLDESGKIWITDFGLARFQTDHSVTRSGEILGTLHYMSPEQAAGRNALVDERSDVYSLGVTLYELLTLMRPFEGGAQHAVLQQIELGLFTRPRSCNSRIPVDLENVILKAMSVAREDRYDSAAQFADDLRRFLEGKPTRAKRPRLSQKLTKWARRHQLAVMTTAGVLALAVAGLLTSNRLLKSESDAKQLALNHSQQTLTLAQDAVEEFVEDVDRLLAPQAGNLHARERLLKRSLEYYQQIIQVAGASEHIQKDIVIAKTKIAGIHRMMGNFEQALAGYESAAVALDQLVEEDEQLLVDYIRCLNNVGSVQQRLNRLSQADEAYTKAISIADVHSEDNSQVNTAAAETYNNHGLLLAEQSKVSEAADTYKRGLSVISHNEQTDAADLKVKSALQNNLWQVYRNSHADLARQYIRDAVTTRSRLVQEHPLDEHRALLAAAYSNLASDYIAHDELASANDELDRAANLQRQLVENEPFALNYQTDLAVTLNNLGHVSTKLNRPEQAESSYQESLEILEALISGASGDVRLLTYAGGAYNNLALVHREQGMLDDAAQEFQSGMKHLEAALNASPNNAKLRESLSRNYFNYSQLLIGMNRAWDASRVSLRRRDLWPNDPIQLHAVAVELTMAYKKATEKHKKRMERDAVNTIVLAKNAGWRPQDVTTDVVLNTFRRNPQMRTFALAEKRTEGGAAGE
ncbi:MAG: serine/threonine protein kinase [Planctomycetales bacterium]|nr:serine/threonine protein kinase [Planctomycetales bacterium]